MVRERDYGDADEVKQTVYQTLKAVRYEAARGRAGAEVLATLRPVATTREK
jgi:hypothetical protein